MCEITSPTFVTDFSEFVTTSHSPKYEFNGEPISRPNGPNKFYLITD